MDIPHHTVPAALPIRPPESIILSDFDYTLCHTYGYDPVTNNHLPIIDPELVDAAQDHHLVIATGRRANHPSLPILWASGLVHPDVPVIAENGGTLVYNDQRSNKPSFIDLVSPEDTAALHASRQLIEESITDIPAGQQLIFKLGRTMLLTRLQNPAGDVDPIRQQQLVAQLRGLLPGMQIADTRVSITIQHPEINKWRGFLTYLRFAGIKRDDTYVVGMGDGENDADIFAHADFSVGFSPIVRRWVDIEVPAGAAGAPAVLRSIRGRRLIRASV